MIFTKLISRISLFSLVVAATLSIILLFPKNTHASGETYTWQDRNTLIASGGGLPDKTVIKFMDTGKGGINPTTQSGFWPVIGGHACLIPISIKLTDPGGGKNFTIDVLSDQNQPPASFNQGSGYCNKDDPSYKQFDGNFTITNTWPSAQTEMPEQRTVTVLVQSRGDPLPQSVLVKLISGGKTIATATVNASSQPAYTTVFNDISPGDLNVCATIAGSDSCNTYTKIGSTPLSAVVFGPLPLAADAKIAHVNATINPQIDDPRVDQSFGPYTFDLTDKDGKVLQSKNATYQYSAKGCVEDNFCGGVIKIGNNIDFINLEPGNYRVCLSSTTTCVEFTKVVNTPVNIDFNLSNSDLAALSSEQDDTSSCAIEGIGWLICPVMNFIAKLNDNALAFISNFLETPADMFGNPDFQRAWSTFRDIANVLFVIAFMIIVYSQITGAGITNYGMKKLLPKLIIAAVLVNASYLLCQLAVDVTNILGFTLNDMFKNIFKASGQEQGWVDTTGTILAATTGVLLALALLALIFLAPVVLLVLALTFLTLVVRSALIILLIVISPIAFVAFLLPNTEQWFKKWWKMFSTLLLIFPTIALVFGASSLAARIVQAVGAEGGGLDGALKQVVALGIIAVPLFAVPVLLKGALAATGAIGAKLSGWQDKATGKAKSQYSKGKDARKERRSNRRMIRALDGRANKLNPMAIARRRRARRNAIDASNKSLAGRAETAYIAEETREGNDRLVRQMAGGKRASTEKAEASIRASAIAVDQKASNEAVENSMALLQDSSPEKTIERAQAAFESANKSGDMIAARAASRVLLKHTGSKGVQALNDTVSNLQSGDGSIDEHVFEAMQHEISVAGVKDKDRSLDILSRSAPGTKLHDISTDADALGLSGLNEAELAGQSAKQLRKYVASGTLTTQQAQRVLDAHAKGTVHLDDDRLGAFQSAVSISPTEPEPTTPTTESTDDSTEGSSSATPPTRPGNMGSKF